MNQESQQAYILNEKLKQYLGVVNSSYGQQGISETGKIQVANNLSQNIGSIQQNANMGKNDAYTSYLNALENQRLQGEDRNYQQGLINDQRTYEQSQYDKQYKDLLSQQREDDVKGAIHNEFASILSKVSSANKVDSEVIRKKLLELATGQYAQYLNEESMKNLEIYINMLLAGEVMGTGEVTENDVTKQNATFNDSKSKNNNTMYYMGGS